MLTFRVILLMRYIGADKSRFMSIDINPFVPNAPFLYPQKTSRFSRGRERVHWEQVG